MLVNDDINLLVEFVVISVSVPPWEITTLLFQPYMYDWVMLLVVLYDIIMMVWMTWHTDDSVTTICDDVMSAISIRTLGTMNNVLSDVNHTHVSFYLLSSSSSS